MEENRITNETAPVKKQRSLWDEAWRRFKKNKTAMAGLVYLGILVVIAVSTTVIDWVTHNQVYKSYIIKQDLLHRLKGPSWQHIFGQDEFGRDIFLRMLWGTRYSLFMGALAILFVAVTFCCALLGGVLYLCRRAGGGDAAATGSNE